MTTFSFFTPYIAIVASLLGLLAAITIFIEKRKKKKMICPLQANCDKVVHSTHSTTFGISNELLGILYYLVIGSLYALILAWPEFFATAGIHYLMLLMTFVGVILSVYFVILQAFVIRAWCSWCMLSAVACFALGACLFGLIDAATLELIASHRTLWIIIHSFGFILGVGGATITDVFFFKFMKNHQIAVDEKSTMDTLSGVILAGLAVAVLSGFMLFLPEQARLAVSAKFLVKVVVVGVVIINGIALNLLVAPRMHRLSFEGTKPARSFRRLAFALGGISIVSWYTAFILGSLRHLGEYSFVHGLIGYAAILIAVVVGSQIFERIAVRHYHALPENQEE